MQKFIKDETGAVTVDWVVLTAALVGLGLAAMSVVATGVEDLSTDIDETLSNQLISTSFSTPYEAYYPDMFANFVASYSDPDHDWHSAPTQENLQASYEADMAMVYTSLENDWPFDVRVDYLQVYLQVAEENGITLSNDFAGNPNGYTVDDVDALFHENWEITYDELGQRGMSLK